MSGTSLDGLDLVAVTFSKNSLAWRFKIEKAVTVDYPHPLKTALKYAIRSSPDEIQSLDYTLGEFIGHAIRTFYNGIEKIDFIASHGHTVFHQPNEGLTVQIGSGQIISKITKLPVINNFRQKDVSLGGQGAPLVPIGDRDLFSAYDYCLNLGGIANISYQDFEKRIAYDICPFNMVLNDLAAQKGLDYDDKGRIASGGSIDQTLLNSLNQIAFLSKDAPKSLGLEDYKSSWLPQMEKSSRSIDDQMCTFTEHAAIQIGKTLAKGKPGDRLLITGGGAFHDFFINRLKHHTQVQVCIPDTTIIDFKEGLVFAYLGLLRYLDMPNALASVTGASRNSSGGDLFNF